MPCSFQAFKGRFGRHTLKNQRGFTFFKMYFEIQVADTLWRNKNLVIFEPLHAEMQLIFKGHGRNAFLVKFLVTHSGSKVFR